jgi:DNA-directed RNA polymerase beta subunit
MANSIPLSDHNQSPRNTYQSAMGKQAMGIFARNYAKRLDKNGYILCSPMRPFVETRTMNILKTQDMPSGDNIIVAIAMYGGYNQEDSVILNKSSVNRGLFRTLYYTIYKDEEHRNVASGKEEKFTKPRRENTRGFKNSSYHAIQENGMPALNSIIKENGKLYKVEQAHAEPYYVNDQHILTLYMPDHKCIFWNETKNGWTVLWWNHETMTINQKTISFIFQKETQHL